MEREEEIFDYSRDILDEQPIWSMPGGPFSTSDPGLLSSIVGMEDC